MLASIVTSSALACGGFFCDPGPPGFDNAVQQTGESVVFAVDSDTQTTTMHVQVAYEGPAEDFAWVLPTPAEPELLRSPPSLFTWLDGGTQPIYTVQHIVNDCWQGGWGDGESDADTDADADADSDADTDSDADLGVTVVDRATVGPYETVTLTATDSALLVTWLQEQEFAVPDDLGPMLGAYIGESTHFVALRLRKNRDAGDLEPLALRFAGTNPSIPVQLTATAVADDMPLNVYVLGDKRAIPENYLHVKLNPLRADWTQFGDPQLELVSAAADEAGGQAFETVSSGPVFGDFHSESRYNLNILRTTTDLPSWLGSLWSAGFTLTLEDLSAVVPVPDEVDPDAFFNCPTCFPEVVAGIAFDAAAFTDALEAHYLEPIREVDAIIDGASNLTRLRTTMSASEMTIDPMFGFSSNLPDVSNIHVLRLTRTCDDPDDFAEDAPYHVEVDGLDFMAPSETELAKSGHDIFSWMRDVSDANTLLIEDLSTSDVLVDNTPLVEDALVQEGAEIRRNAKACGCQSAPMTAAWLALPLLFVRRWRR